jgi:tetratricopeptide (TPR) repeat protein
MQNFMSVAQAKASVHRLERICNARATVRTLSDLALCYFVLGETPSAYKLAQLAFEKDPHNPIVVSNLALILNDAGQHDSSHKAFEMAYKELAPEDPYIALGYAESLLRKGSWQEAWPIHEFARAQAKEEAAIAAGIPEKVKLWNGKSPVVQLLLIEEGGLGDSITYSRWLPELTKRGINWKYMPYDELRGFYARASWCGPERLISPGEKPQVSHWTTTFSIPAILGATPKSVPEFPEPFKVLTAVAAKYQRAKSSLPAIGLCWSSDETRHGGRKVHSLSEGQAMRLVCKTDHLVNWVNLQYDAKLPEPVSNVRISTMEDLAGLMSNLDAVVSVSSAPMLLAQALGWGKRLIVLLSANSDWKFLESGSSPFYPDAVTFRSSSPGVERAIDQAINFVDRNWGEKQRLIVMG